MNRQERRAAQAAEQGRSSAAAQPCPDAPVHQLFEAALGLHRSGQFVEAERLYRRILAIDPRHIASLHLSGVLAHQLGQHQVGMALIERAYALDGRDPDIRYNMANMLAAAGRLDEAIAHYAEASRLRPHYAAADFEHGNVLARLGRFDDAATQYRRALEGQPRHVQALTNLGNALAMLGRSQQAVAAWQSALGVNPDNPTPHLNLGIAMQLQGRLDDAATHFQRVITLIPDSVEAYDHLARTLLAAGRAMQAIEVSRRAIAIKPTSATKTIFVDCLRHIQIGSDEPELRELVQNALHEPWGRPDKLIGPAATLAKQHVAIAAGVARVAQTWPQRLAADRLWSPSGRSEICSDPLLRALLEAAPICDLELERFLTTARGVICAEARAATNPATVDETTLAFACALAQQCFINEYVFALEPDEAESARVLGQMLSAALRSGHDIPPLWIAAVASYVPLHAMTEAPALMTRPWPPAIRKLLVQQIQEPLDEQADRAAIPALTDIDNAVSVAVRRQYEENPYPRWIKIPAARPFDTFEGYLRGLLPGTPFHYKSRGAHCEILVAGCGTGHHAIEVGLRSRDARVLAIDLSLASLAYARRKTRELGISNIDYAQADLLKVAAIGRTFDVIETGGVLHHLDDPMQGWRALLAQLRPGGMMFVGLYSALGRREVVNARAFIAGRGDQQMADGIRLFRQDIASADHGPAMQHLLTSPDFFSASGCRDLFFHTQEHRLTLPQIQSFLQENRLAFLGFNLDAQIVQKFRRRFPADGAQTDLALWHDFETANPNAFSAMYQFWIQKPQ
jgi:tetratricopeptide (TPR) repeat protein/2-polyprenyl-3-methyl-5-hydroxy-6-metoxy-1,4-benzoquinol methylase